MPLGAAFLLAEAFVAAEGLPRQDLPRQASPRQASPRQACQGSLDLFIENILDETPVHTPVQVFCVKPFAADLDGAEKDECADFSSAFSSILDDTSAVHDDAHEATAATALGLYAPGDLFARFCADGAAQLGANAAHLADTEAQYSTFVAATSADASASNNSFGQRGFNLSCGLNCDLLPSGGYLAQHKPPQLLQELLPVRPYLNEEQLHAVSSTVQRLAQAQAQAQAELKVSAAMAQQPLPLDTGSGRGHWQAQQLRNVQEMQELASSYRQHKCIQSQTDAESVYTQLLAQAQSQAKAQLEARSHLDLLRLNQFQQNQIHQLALAALAGSTEVQAAQVGQWESAASAAQSAQLAAYAAGRASSPYSAMLSGMGGYHSSLLQRSGMRTAMPSPCVGRSSVGSVVGTPRPVAISDPSTALTVEEVHANSAALSRKRARDAEISGFWAQHASSVVAAAESRRTDDSLKNHSHRNFCQGCGRSKAGHRRSEVHSKCVEVRCWCGLARELHARALPPGALCRGECQKILGKEVGVVSSIASTPRSNRGIALKPRSTEVVMPYGGDALASPYALTTNSTYYGGLSALGTPRIETVVLASGLGVGHFGTPSSRPSNSGIVFSSLTPPLVAGLAQTSPAPGLYSDAKMASLGALAPRLAYIAPRLASLE
ncbi:hypothetical protein T492DRAFT_837729 [Pavlovales sp. CCMP2436]|nr:hypothetical protein T492DRAFT_837729 [Pavlovales sp. CCMP2436]